MSEFYKLVVGLGNPGKEYELTAHNLGFLVVDRVAERNRIDVGRRDCLAFVGQHTAGGQSTVSSGSSTRFIVIPGSPGCFPGRRFPRSRSDRSPPFFR